MVTDNSQTTKMADRPESLSGKDKKSFAFLTIRDRLPDILTKVIDQFVKLASQERSNGEVEKADDAKAIISKFSKLKNEMQTDKEILKLTDELEDVNIWNDFIDKMPILVEGKVKPTWYSAAWLSCECYLYRRIYEILQLSNSHASFDPFFDQKSKAFFSSEKPMETLAGYLIKFIHDTPQNMSDEELRGEFEMFLEYCLWGNKCDLSISSGTQVSNQLKESSQLKDLLEHIISNDTDKIWNQVRKISSSNEKSARVDFVLDNSGFEVYTDLCLAEFLLSHGLCDSVHFHVKSMPWFVSDVTRKDFVWTLQQCTLAQDSAVKELGHQWEKRLNNNTFVIVENHYWTLPCDFAAMQSMNAELYTELSKSQLIVFKGDLNYRKLIGDRNWPHTTSFSKALHGFCPAPLCSLRTLKADLVVGLKQGKAEELTGKEVNWMVSGNHAVIQYCDEL